MAVTSEPFHTLAAQLAAGNIKYLASGGDTIKCALFTSAPTLTTASYSSLTGEVSSGGGYTTGGTSLSSFTVTATEANSWGTTAATSTPYSLGNIVRPSTGNGYLYLCVAAGTSGGSAPSWGTVVGETTTDGTVTWENIGDAITVFSSGNASWTSSTITASYAVIYDSTSGYNIVMINFGGSQSDSNGTFTVSPDAVGGWFFVAVN